MKLFSKASAYRGQKRHSPTIAFFFFFGDGPDSFSAGQEEEEKTGKIGGNRTVPSSPVGRQCI